MKKARKLVAAIAAATMVLTNIASVNAVTIVGGIKQADCFSSYGDGSSSASQTTVAQGNSDSSANTTTLRCGSTNGARCVIQLLGTGSQVTIRQGAFSTSGTRAMSIIPSYGNNINNDSGSEAGSALVRFIFPVRAVDNEYHVSFNVITSSLTNDPGKKAYATMNWNNLGTDSPKLLYCQNNPGEGQWTVTNIGSGADNGGMGTTQTWYTYEGTLIASNDENELRFSAYGWDRFHIDDIVIKDKNGVVIFSEDFEKGEFLSTLTTRWTHTNVTDTVDYNIVPESASNPTNHALKIYGNSGSCFGRFSIDIPYVKDNTYYLTYDKISNLAANIAVNLNGDTWTQTASAGAGTETKTLTGGARKLYICASGWANAWIDNICLKDKNGNIVFFEDFEDSSVELSYATVKQGGETVATLSTGTATVSAKVRNNYQSTAIPNYFIVALYDSTDSQLEHIYYQNKSVSKGTEQTFSLDVPVTAGQKMRVFWWERMTGNIVPLRTSVLYQ